MIVKLKMDKDRKRILERKAMSRVKAMADKGKYTEETIETSWISAADKSWEGRTKQVAFGSSSEWKLSQIKS